jgi:hypothetical protein
MSKELRQVQADNVFQLGKSLLKNCDRSGLNDDRVWRASFAVRRRHQRTQSFERSTVNEAFQRPTQPGVHDDVLDNLDLVVLDEDGPAVV